MKAAETISEVDKGLLEELIKMRDNLHLTTTHIEIEFFEKLGDKPEKDYLILICGSESYSKLQNVETFKEHIKSLNNEKIYEDIQCREMIGSPFPQVEDCLHIASNEVRTFSHQKGEVLLIEIWSLGCTYCQAPMIRCQEMLDNNPEWIGKVRIAGFAVEPNLKGLKERIESKKLFKVEHYRLNKYWDTSILKQNDILGIPTIFLIDKEGILRFLGHPNTLDLKYAINALLDDKQLSYNEDIANSTRAKVTAKDKDEVTENIRKFLEENKSIIPNKYGYFKISISKKLTKDNIDDFDDLDYEGTITAISCEISTNKDNIVKYKTALTELLTNFPKFRLDIIYYFKQQFIPTVGTECLKCNCALGNNVPRFFCYECQTSNKGQHTFCANCVKVDEDFESNSVHEHVLYYLPAGAGDQLNQLRNVHKSSEIKDNCSDKITGYNCDNCGKDVETLRLSCAVCFKHVYKFNICNDCFRLGLAEGKECELKEHVEHDFKKHIMIRIPYNMYCEDEDFEFVD
jgi:hypothetical protein